MFSRLPKFFIIFISVAALFAVLIIGGKVIIFKKINSAIRAQADSLRQKGFDLRFDSLETSAFRNLISIENVRLKFPRNTSACEDSTDIVAIAKIEIRGIHFLPLLLHRELKLTSITVTHPRYYYSKAERTPSKQAPGKPALHKIDLEQLNILSAEVYHYDSGTCRTISKIRLDSLGVSGIAITNPGMESVAAAFDDVVIKHAELKLPKAFYTITVRRFEWQNASHSFRLDSLKVKPDYNRTTFAELSKTQIDRIEWVIPSVTGRGAEVTLTKEASLHVRHIDISFIASIFHDKRYPDSKPILKKLPSRSLHDIAMDLQLDTILISRSSITYEEFPVGGTRAGLISFNDLSARIGNMSTRSSRPMTMAASARFMNAGDLKANFTIPADPLKAYTIDGSVKNLNLTELNKILMPVAKIEVRSGQLHEMKFGYEYNEYRADGNLTMSYNHLDLAGLAKNGKEKDVNKLLTFVIHAIVKTDMEKASENGKILYYHDATRSTFNYWWKSILSGIKSLFGLDKIMDTAHSKKK